MQITNSILVVLGYPAKADGTPSPILQARLDKAISLYHNNISNKIILTGAAVANNHIEAQVMAKYCIQQGIPQADLFIETSAKNTYENARMVRKMMRSHGFLNAIIVTSGFHKMRAERFFSKHLNNVQVVAAPFPDKFPIIKQWYLQLKEYLILILYHIGLLNNRYSVNQS